MNLNLQVSDANKKQILQKINLKVVKLIKIIEENSFESKFGKNVRYF